MSVECKCKICGTTSNVSIYKVKEMMFGTRDEFEYFQCPSCECLQIKDIPEDLSVYYGSNYYNFKKDNAIFYKNPFSNILKNVLDNLILFVFKSQLKYLQGRDETVNTGLVSLSKISNLKKTSKILDIGCGNGILLYRLVNAGFTNLTGLDPFVYEDIKYKNLTIYKKNIEDVKDEFEIITLHHVFEHLSDPLDSLLKIKNILSKNGTLLIRIPIVPNLMWDKYKDKWVQLDAPRHLFLHSIKSMELLAEKSGFTIEKIFYDSNDLQFIGTEQYIQDIPLTSDKSHLQNINNSIFTKEQIASFKEQAKEANEKSYGDQVCLYLRKK
jgi:SAM-dependent methyltransferase